MVPTLVCLSSATASPSAMGEDVNSVRRCVKLFMMCVSNVRSAQLCDHDDDAKQHVC